MDSIPRIRRELVARFEKLVRTRALALGIGTVDFRDWVDGMVGEGIAIAIVEQEKWDPKKGDFLHWSFLKTRGLVRKEIRAEERYRKVIDKLKRLAHTEDSPDRMLDQLVLREELVSILSELTREQRKGLALYYLTGMSVKTLSNILGKQPKTVYVMLERARAKARSVSEELELDFSDQEADEMPLPRPSTGLRSEEMSFEEKRRRREQQRAIERLYDEG